MERVRQVDVGRVRQVRPWVVALTALALAGCSGDGEGGSAQPPDPGTQVATDGGAAQPDALATAPPLQVAASRDATVPAGIDRSIPVRADVAPVQRRGDLVVLNVTLTHTGDDGDWQIGTALDDGTTNGLEGSTNDQDPARFTVDGISLVDGASSKRHLVARDERGWCLCSGPLSGVFLRPGSSVVLSATYAAPPEDVSALDVEVPLFGTFAAVPVVS